MKRAILILFGLVVTFLLLNRVWNPARLAKEETVKLSGSNVGASHTSPTRSQRAIEPLQITTTNSSSTNENEGIEWIKLSREQVDAYLLKTKRSPESLLNAFIETHDTNFLAEALEKYPDNPIVQWTMVSQGSPEERSQWLEKLKMSSPDNGLPNYLLALDNFKSGNAEKALAEIDAASQKKVSSFERERAQSREEMYLLTGYPPLEAKQKASESVDYRDLPEMKQLSWQIDELQKKYQAAGDSDSNKQLAAVGVEVARKYSDEKTNPILLNQLVGYAMESIALRNLDANTHYDFLGNTAGERLQEMKSQRQEWKDLARDFARNYSNLSDAEKTIYLDRSNLYGELNAMRWLKKNYGSETK